MAQRLRVHQGSHRATAHPTPMLPLCFKSLLLQFLSETLPFRCLWGFLCGAEALHTLGKCP